MAQTEERFIGTEFARKEDPELVTGQATYIDNHTMPGMVWMEIVRTPFAHAKLNSVDVSAAKQMPGVLDAWTGADLRDEWAGSLPFVWPMNDEVKVPEHLPLTTDKVRYLGDGVAVVVAQSREQAADAAEAVTYDCDPLPVVTDPREAAKDDAPLVHEGFGTNVLGHWDHGGSGDVEGTFANAPVTVTEEYWQPRLIPNAMEPRGLLAASVASMGEFTLWSSTQIPHIAKVTLSLTTGISESKLRIVAPDVGGGFGSKLNVYAEEALALVATKRLGRPVKWIETRSENYIATIHGRGVWHKVELCGTQDGTLTGIRVKEIADCGAYFQLLTPAIPELGGWVYMGPYDLQCYAFEYDAVVTNATPTDAYRGAGRPEATYVVERTVDAFARKVGVDPAEVRRKSLVAPFAEARENICGLTVDSGNYEPILDKALAHADYDGVRADQKARRERGDVKQLGIGLSTYIEMCGLAPSRILGVVNYVAGGWDAANIRVLPTGKVIVATGTSPHGQGHETAWSQIVADGLGVHPDDVEVLHGDTAITPLGMDTYGSRSLAVGGVALHYSMEKIKEKARKIAAHELEVSEDDIEVSGGTYAVRGAPDKAKTVQELAFTAWNAHDLPEGVEPNLEATAAYDPPNFVWPAGAHICISEVDTETGEARIVNYVAFDDCGNVINPMIVDGQVHGGVAQGIAEALYEEAIYDESGNLMTSSLTQYLVPAATEIPSMVLDRTVTPSTTNPLGVKGIGEAGTIAAPPAVVNSIVDAVSHLGVTRIGKPASPERVWRAIQDAQGGGA